MESVYQYIVYPHAFKVERITNQGQSGPLTPALSHKGRGSVAPSPLMGGEAGRVAPRPWMGWDGDGEIGTGLLQPPPHPGPLPQGERECCPFPLDGGRSGPCCPTALDGLVWMGVLASPPHPALSHKGRGSVAPLDGEPNNYNRISASSAFNRCLRSYSTCGVLP